MNDNIKAGAEHHAGDGGYSIGTQERYEEFVKLRNRVPNKQIEDLMYHAGLTAQGCWDEMDDYAKQAIERFAELIVKECMTMSDELKAQYLTSRKSTMDFDEKNIYAEGEAACYVLKYKMKKHFGVKE
jgi:hypothetical protein